MNEKRIVECLSAVRVQLNWKQAFAEGWPVSVLPLAPPASLTNLFVPWYRGNNGQEVGFDHAEAQTVTVGQVASTLSTWSDIRQNGIYQYAVAYRNSGRVDVSIPVYALPNADYLILDGNHRAVALALAEVPFVCQLVVIQGPLDATALPDLIHWQEYT